MTKPTDSTYIKVILLVLFVALLFVVPAKAQSLPQNSEETCRGPVFSAREVSRRATITSRQFPAMTQEALAHDVHGSVVLEAVLCRTGRITDLRVVESLPYGMTEKCLAAIREIKFTPAEMNWHTVSQKMRFEFHFNERGVDEIAAKDCEGRIVAAVEVVGNRRLTANEIIGLIQARPGDPCSVQQTKKDIAAILATGYFDSGDTGVETEIRADGRVVIVIKVHELPLISEMKFEGLRDVPESAILDALRKVEIDLGPGGVYDPARVKRAITVIRSVLASKGQPDAVIEVLTESSATSVVLTFVISGYK